MPQELPGFYYDAEKNRYFPIKGPIPGSSRIASSSSSCATTAQKKLTDHKQISKAHKGLERTSTKLLQSRELCGNAITSTKRKYNFREEYQKSQVSEPMIWRYDHTTKMADCALEHVHVDVDTPDGALRTEILIAGGLNGFFSLSEIGKDAQQFNFGVASTPDPVVLKEGSAKSPEHLWWPKRASVNMESTISCIKMFKKLHPHSTGVVASKQHALITTLGSETSGGSVYILDLSDSMEFNTRFPISRRLNKISLFNCTIWTADGNFDGHQAAIGTNLGTALVNIETGAPSWFFRCKSDVLSLQLDYSGNNVLCGLRNGAIVTVDVRQKPDGHARLARQRIPLPSRKIKKTSSRSQNLNKQWFEFKGDIYNSCTVAMPSSISCLASLKLYDQYFLASSMDGSIKLYDHRLTQKGAVQSYEGHVNSHTRIQLGVDPSEKFIISGGEDCKLRIWSFKSGELLFEEKFMNTAPSVVCWQKNDGGEGSRNEYVEYDETLCGGAWIGSQEGLFHMKWS